MSESPFRTISPFAYGFVVCVVGTLAFANSFYGVYVFDDRPNIVDNPSLRSFQASWQAEGKEIPKGLRRRDVGRWSFAVNYAISGLNTWSYHAVNLAIHLTAALLLFGIVRRTIVLYAHDAEMCLDANWLACGIAGLWVVHPLQTESVTYVIQRLESLCGLFYLTCIYCTLRGARSQRPWGWYVATMVACLAGMATKEVMVTLPVVLLCFDRIFLADSWRRLIGDRKWMYAGLAIAMAGLLWSASGSILPKFQRAEMMTSQPSTSPRIDRSDQVQGDIPSRYEFFISQPGVVLHYIKLAFWPQGQCLDYMWPAAENVREVLLPMAVILAIGVFGFWSLRKHPPVGFLILSFFVILSPTSSIIRLRVAFEHRMYLPLACLIALVVIGCYQLTRLRLLMPAVLTLAVIALGFATHERNKVYYSRIAMFRDNVAKAPHNPRAHLNLADAYLRAGKLTETQAAVEAAIELRPKDSASWLRVGSKLVQWKAYLAGSKCLQQALKFNPEDAVAHHRLAEALERLGNWEAAALHFEEAIRLAPQDSQIRNDFGAALAARGQPAEAEEQLRLALDLNAESAEAHNTLGTILMMRNQSHSEAISHFRQALMLDPTYDAARLNLKQAMR